MSQERATIYDVAAAAGVATSTVSRVFSHPDRVAYATAEKVRRIANELGYRSRAAVRTGDERRTGLIGLVVADITNPFFTELIRGSEEAADARGSSVVVLNANESRRRGAAGVKRMMGRVDGFILASSRLDDGDIRKVAKAAPVIVCNRPVQGVPSVLVDNRQGTEKAIAHLLERGHTSVTYLAGPVNAWADGIRWRGVVESDMPHRRVATPRPTISGGAATFAEWDADRTDAVLAYNDRVAVGFIREAARHGVSVPGDVAVVGFDNTLATTLMHPSVTTVAAPLRTVGGAAAHNLMSMIAGTRPETATSLTLPSRLVVRESS